MKMRISGLFLRLTFLTVTIFYASGCAQQMRSVKSELLSEQSANAEIKSVNISDDASKVEIITDRSIVYTYYMLDSPPRLIIDLAQAIPVSLPLPINVNKGNIKQIAIAKHEFASGVLSRIEVSLADKVDVTVSLDPMDQKRLLLTLPVVKVTAAADSGGGDNSSGQVDKAAVIQAESANVAVAASASKAEGEKSLSANEPVTDVKVTAQPIPAEETVIVAPVVVTESVIVNPVQQAEPQIQAKPESQVNNDVKSVGSPALTARSLTAITAGNDRIYIEISAPVESFKSFRLSQPDRLVIDIANTKNLIASKQVDINRFNFAKARIGQTVDKLRIVFDATGGSIPVNQVKKVDNGLQILIGEPQKVLVSPTQPLAEKVSDVEASAKLAAPRQDTTPQLATSQAVSASGTEAAAVEVQVSSSEKAPEAKSVSSVETAPAAAITAEPAVSATVPPLSPTAGIAVNPKTLPVVKSGSAPAVIAANAGVVDAIEFTQSEGLSLITVRTSGNCAAVGPVKSAKGLQLTLKGCRLPANLQRPLLTSGFNSVITDITPYPVKVKKGNETRVAVNLKSAAPYALKQEANVYSLEIREPVKPARSKKTVQRSPVSPSLPGNTASADAASAVQDRDLVDSRSVKQKIIADKPLDEVFALEKVSTPASRGGKIYTGRKVSLEFSDADVRKIFQLLAEVSNQNFLISDDVTGTISLKLVNVPWDQALDVILENKGLGMQKDGNIVQIRPKTKMRSLDDEALEMRIIEEKKMPLSTVLFDINFATLSEIEAQFRNLKSKRNDSSISSDVRTNKIIVVDIEPNIKKMRNLLESLDVPEKQVMIEARIVEASSSFARDIGIKWGFGYQDGSASVANINDVTGSMGGVVTTGITSTGGITTGVTFGKLLSNVQLDMRLSAASTVGQVKIISTPKVMTVNNKPARISQGQKVPYQNTSSSEGAKTEFVDATLSLDVTPHITADGSVSMKIKANNNSVGTGSPPSINTKEATTELVVKNGETTVIGGIYVDSETEGDTGVPYLSEIPLFGWLFKSNSKLKSKNELLIFITPKIMN